MHEEFTHAHEPRSASGSSFGVLTHTAYNIEYNEDPVVAPETLYVLVLQRSLGK